MWMTHISKSCQSVRFFACPISETSATARCVLPLCPARGSPVCARGFFAPRHPAYPPPPPPPLPRRRRHAPCSNFFFAHYNQVKTLAPNFAFQIRHTGEEPYMMVEYDFGETAKVGLGGLKEADIRRKVRARARAPPSPPSRPPAFAQHAHRRAPGSQHAHATTRTTPAAGASRVRNRPPNAAERAAANGGHLRKHPPGGCRVSGPPAPRVLCV